MPSRPDADRYFIGLASVVSSRGTCARRKVGAVLVNKYKHILGTGYNGPPRGLPHCIDQPCPGVGFSSGTGLDKCEAVHAEQNALLQCRDVNEIVKCYCTLSPCIHCVKLLMNTSCREIVFLQEYSSEQTQAARDLWVKSGRKWKQWRERENLLRTATNFLFLLLKALGRQRRLRTGRTFERTRK